MCKGSQNISMKIDENVSVENVSTIIAMFSCFRNRCLRTAVVYFLISLRFLVTRMHATNVIKWNKFRYKCHERYFNRTSPHTVISNLSWQRTYSEPLINRCWTRHIWTRGGEQIRRAVLWYAADNQMTSCASSLHKVDKMEVKMGCYSCPSVPHIISQTTRLHSSHLVWDRQNLYRSRTSNELNRIFQKE
jgi:hypothetical protein